MSGNAIKNSKPIKKEDYSTLITNRKNVLPYGLNIYPYGSIGKKEISGDADFFIDSAELLSILPAQYPVPNISESRKLLQEHFINQGLESIRSGVSVFVGIPIYDEIVQVDLTTVDDAYNMMYLHDHVYENETMKGKDVVSIWCDLANLTSTSLKISPYKGLVNRETNQIIEIDPDKIAKIIIGPHATVHDMRSPSRLLVAVIHDPIKYQHIKNNYFQ
jgi:hypothetical protein